MNFYRYPEWAANLTNLYWQIRMARTRNACRTWYRRIADEKQRLARLGIDTTYLRLIGLSLTTTNTAARNRRIAKLREYENDLKAWSAPA